MTLPANKVSLSVAVVLILLLFSAASFSMHARSRSNVKIQRSWDSRVSVDAPFSVYPRSRSYYGRIQSTWDNKDWKFHPNFETTRRVIKYKDARRRWYESFLPSILTDSGEPRLLHCYTFDVNGFLTSLTRAKALALADKPGVRRMLSDDFGPYSYSTRSCGFVTTTSMKRSFVRSRLAF